MRDMSRDMRDSHVPYAEGRELIVSLLMRDRTFSLYRVSRVPHRPRGPHGGACTRLRTCGRLGRPRRAKMRNMLRATAQHPIAHPREALMRTLDLRKNRPGRQPHAPQSAVDAYPCACCGQPVPEIAAYGQDPHCSRRCAEAARHGARDAGDAGGTGVLVTPGARRTRVPQDRPGRRRQSLSPDALRGRGWTVPGESEASG